MQADLTSVETPPSGLRPKKDADPALQEKAGGTKPLPQFLEEKARGQERKRQQNITARHRHRKYPKGLTQAKPHINPTNKIVKGVFPKWLVFMHHLPYACLIYLLNIFH